MRKYHLLFIVFAALLASVLYAYKHLSAFLLSQIQNKMQNTFAGYYQLSFTNLTTRISIRSLDIHIAQPTFVTDTAKIADFSGYPALFFHADEIHIDGISIWDLLMKRQLRLDRVAVYNPLLNYFFASKSDLVQATDTLANTTPKKALDYIFMNQILLSGGSMAVAHINTPHEILYSGKEIELLIDDVHLNTSTKTKLNTDSVFNNLRLSMKHMEFHPLKSLHAFGAARLDVNLKQKSIDVHQVDVLPHKNILKLSKENRYQKTFAEVHLGNLKLEGIAHNDLLDGKFTVQKLVLEGARIHLMRNKTKPMDEDLIKPTLQQTLKKIGLALQVDTVQIRNMNMDVGLLFHAQAKPAHIKLSNISGNIYNMHNNPHSTKRMRVDLKGNAMQNARIRFKIDMPMHQNTHQYSAVIEQMPLADWNDVIGKAAPVRIIDGVGKKLTLKGTADAMHTSGTMVFEYNNLKCEVLRTDKEGNTKKAYLKTWLANTTIRNNNPAKTGESPLEVNYAYTRQLYQGHEMLWIGGLMEGMIATMLPAMVKTEMDKVKEKKKLRKKGQSHKDAS